MPRNSSKLIGTQHGAQGILEVVCTSHHFTTFSCHRMFVALPTPANCFACTLTLAMVWANVGLAGDRSHVKNSLGMRFVEIEAGEFVMGSPKNEPGRSRHENQRKVKIARPFYLGMHEVTQEQFQSVMGKNTSAFSSTGGFQDRVKEIDTRQFPVDSVNWHQANEFCRRLSAMAAEKDARRTYRLPTEAEWEYACRAGTDTIWSHGSDPRLLKKYVNFGDRDDGRPRKVGSLRPNAWGLHDMHGNVWEWCADEYVIMEIDSDDAPPSRVIRGGSWFSVIANTRSATRLGDPPGVGDPDTGFRVVMELQREP